MSAQNRPAVAATAEPTAGGARAATPPRTASATPPRSSTPPPKERPGAEVGATRSQTPPRTVSTAATDSALQPARTKSRPGAKGLSFLACGNPTPRKAAGSMGLGDLPPATDTKEWIHLLSSVQEETARLADEHKREMERLQAKYARKLASGSEYDSGSDSAEEPGPPPEPEPEPPTSEKLEVQLPLYSEAFGIGLHLMVLGQLQIGKVDQQLCEKLTAGAAEDGIGLRLREGDVLRAVEDVPVNHTDDVTCIVHELIKQGATTGTFAFERSLVAVEEDLPEAKPKEFYMQELARARETLRLQVAVHGTAGALLGNLFDAVDTDDTGFLEEAEAKRFLLVAGCTEQELTYYYTDMLRRVDKDGDGLISKIEFQEYVLGDEELTEAGDFKDSYRRLELVEQLHTIGPAAQLITALFDAIDTDGSQSLEEDEGKVFLRVAGCAEDELEYYWGQIVRRADRNQDRVISREEFIAHILNKEQLDEAGCFADLERRDELRIQLGMVGPAGKLIEALFDAIDSDNSGTLDEVEGRAFLRIAGVAKADVSDSWASMLHSADKNGDVNISKDEFMSYVLAEEELNDQGDFRSADRRTELESQVGLVTHGGVVVKEAIESFKAEIIARIEQSIFDFQGIIKVVDALAKKPSERATNKQVQLVGANFQQRLEEVVPKIDDFVALLLTSGRRILADGSVNVSDIFLDTGKSKEKLRERSLGHKQEMKEWFEHYCPGLGENAQAELLRQVENVNALLHMTEKEIRAAVGRHMNEPEYRVLLKGVQRRLGEKGQEAVRQEKAVRSGL